MTHQKHRFLSEYLTTSRHAWKKWQHRVFIDPFSGPGRIQVKGESYTRDGGALVAWRALQDTAPFTRMCVGDSDKARADACAQRLRALGAPAQSFPGLASETVPQMISTIPTKALCFAYVDPYNLELLSFDILKALAQLRVDLAINFSTMDLQRNAEFEFDPNRARFDGTAPGWRDAPAIQGASKFANEESSSAEGSCTDGVRNPSAEGYMRRKREAREKKVSSLCRRLAVTASRAAPPTAAAEKPGRVP